MKTNAQRIVSLLPGATEWVCALGLFDRLVGISHECDFPPQVNSLPRVTRARIDPSLSSAEIDNEVREASQSQTPLYDLDLDALVRLSPDLILTQSLCNVCAVSERDVMKGISGISGGCALLDLHAHTFDDVIGDAKMLVHATGSLDIGLREIESLQSRIDGVRERVGQNLSARPTVTLLEWVDPLFCAGHWTPQLIQWAGGDDPIGRPGAPSRVISADELRQADPDILLVACCGLDLQRTEAEVQTLRKMQGWNDLKCVQKSAVHTFDGSKYFNRPGPRLVDALEMVATIVHEWKSRRLQDV